MLLWYEELHNLLTETKHLSDSTKAERTAAQEYFCNLVEEYYHDNSYPRASYENATCLSRSSYEYLSGIRKCKTTSVENVVYASYWLGISYKEAKLLYLLWFCGSICKEEEYLYWDSVLQELDLITMKRETRERRVMFVKERINK